MSHKNLNGLSFLRLSKGLLVLFLSVILLMLISPSSTRAGCVSDTDTWNKDVSVGRLNSGDENWIKEDGSGEIINKKPIVPNEEEIIKNPKSKYIFYH